MAQAGSIRKRMSAVSGFGYKGEPLTLTGYLTTSTVYETGDVLVAGASGVLTPAATSPAGTTIAGVLCPIAATAPALGTQTPNERTTSATAVNYNQYDDDKEVVFWPQLPGQIFLAHLINSESSFTDARPVSTQIYDAVGIATDAANGLNDFYTFKLAGGTNNDVYRLTRYINPQMTSIADAAFSGNPGQLVMGASGTFNPLTLALPLLSALA